MEWFDKVKETIEDGADSAVKVVADAVDKANEIIDKGEVTVSKGIDYFVYVQGEDNTIKVIARGCDDKLYQQTPQVVSEHVEINSKNLDKMAGYISTEKSGRFSFTFKCGDDEVYRYVEINPYTGSIADSNIEDFLNTQSIITTNYALSYGFYDAGISGSNQAYMYLTENFSNWMGKLVERNQEFKTQPFSLFVLPGSHDAGMFIDVIDETVQAVSGLQKTIVEELGWNVSSKLSSRLLRNLSLTQKESISNQLLLGTRYFDFRPGHNAWDSKSPLYHQHFVVPGCSLSSFIQQIVEFLNTHTSEVVVVGLSSDGFSFDSMKPREDVVMRLIKDAVDGYQSSIQLSTEVDDLEKSYEELLNINCRLIVLWKPEFKDSYSDDAYQTKDVRSIKTALDETLSSADKNQPLMLQLQGTANGRYFDDIRSFITNSDASSLLMSTKGQFDQTTYRWLSQLDVSKLPTKKTVVCLNDFVENGLVSRCQKLSKQRFINYKDFRL